MEFKGFLKLYAGGELIAAPIVIMHKESENEAEVGIRTEYQEKTYSGIGKNLDWTDAFANLQKALPDDVKIHCCMTCRYGTLCPYGCIPNYILCSENAAIKSDSDVIDWLDKVDENSIKRSSFGYCEKYCSANENDYTYNDYLYYLNH